MRTTLMEEMAKHGRVGLAAMRAGMDRKTARKYVQGGKLPSELIEPRSWRTHEDAFLEHWPELEAMLIESPALEAKTLFEVLMEKYPGRYQEGKLRTLQRRVKDWRAERGPDKDVVLAQLHRPDEAAQTDFTWTTVIGRPPASRRGRSRRVSSFASPHRRLRAYHVRSRVPRSPSKRAARPGRKQGSYTQAQRVIALYDALHRGATVRVDVLAEELGASTRQIQRDLKALKEQLGDRLEQRPDGGWHIPRERKRGHDRRLALAQARPRGLRHACVLR